MASEVKWRLRFLVGCFIDMAHLLRHTPVPLQYYSYFLIVFESDIGKATLYDILRS